MPTVRPGRRRAFPVELSQTSFVRQSVIEWLEQNGDAPFFVHASFIRPHPPRRNPIGYHDLYPAEAVGPFVGCATPEEEGAIHPLGAFAVGSRRGAARPVTSGSAGRCGPRTTGRSARWTTGWLRSSTTSTQSGLAESTLVVLTSDHGEMGGDHWLLEKLGFWDESYHVPLIVVDPRREADGARGTIVEAVTESVDVLPTICDFMGIEVPLPGRRLVARSVPARRAGPRRTGATRRTSNGASRTRSTCWPNGPSGSR